MKSIYQPLAAAGIMGMLAMGFSLGCEEQNAGETPVQMPDTDDSVNDPTVDPQADPNNPAVPPAESPYNNNTTPPNTEN